MSTMSAKADDALPSPLNLHSQPHVQVNIRSVQSLGGNDIALVVNKAAGLQNGTVRGLGGHSQESSDNGSNPTEKTLSSNSPIAATLKRNVVVVHICSNKRSTSHRFFANVFTILQNRGISVDLVSTSEVQVSAAINTRNLRSDQHFKDAVADLTRLGEVNVHTDKVILSLAVGADVSKTASMAGQMFATLGEQGVSIEMISYQAGEAKISCIIPAKHATSVLGQLDTELLDSE